MRVRASRIRGDCPRSCARARWKGGRYTSDGFSRAASSKAGRASAWRMRRVYAVPSNTQFFGFSGSIFKRRRIAASASGNRPGEFDHGLGTGRAKPAASALTASPRRMPEQTYCVGAAADRQHEIAASPHPAATWLGSVFNMSRKMSSAVLRVLGHQRGGRLTRCSAHKGVSPGARVRTPSSHRRLSRGRPAHRRQASHAACSAGAAATTRYQFLARRLQPAGPLR